MSQQINLFNPVFLKQKKTFSALNMLEALGLLLIGVIVFYGLASFQTVELARQADETARLYRQSKLQLADFSARYAPKKADAALDTEVKNLQAELNARQALLASMGVGALTNDTSYAEYMRALARQSLGGLWLTSFRIGNGGAQMEIIGRALQPELVPSYIRRLNQERTLQGRAFDSLLMTRKQETLPAEVSAASGAPPSYSYTEFRLGSNHAELPPAAATEPAAAQATGLVQGEAVLAPPGKVLKDFLPAQNRGGAAR